VDQRFNEVEDDARGCLGVRAEKPKLVGVEPKPSKPAGKTGDVGKEAVLLEEELRTNCAKECRTHANHGAFDGRADDAESYQRAKLVSNVCPLWTDEWRNARKRDRMDLALEEGCSPLEKRARLFLRGDAFNHGREVERRTARESRQVAYHVSGNAIVSDERRREHVGVILLVQKDVPQE